MKLILLYVLLLLPFFSICQVYNVAIDQEIAEDNKKKTFNHGDTRNGLKQGLWIEYRDMKFYQPAKTDTFFVSRGRYVSGKKDGKWEYYGDPMKAKDDNYNSFYPKLDSVVIYMDGRYIKKYVVDYNGKIERMLERNDSTIRETTFLDKLLLIDKNFRDDTLQYYVSERYLKKNLFVETYYRENGIPFKELFTNEHYKQELSKDYTQKAFNLGRNSYEPTYTEVLSQKNGQAIMVSNYVDHKLFNVVHYNAKGERLDAGDFKDGNGVLYRRKLQKVNDVYSYVPKIEAVEIYKDGVLTEIHRQFKGPITSWKKGDSAYYMTKVVYHPNRKIFLSEHYENGLLKEVGYNTDDYVPLDVGSFKDGNGWLKRYKLGSTQPYQEEYYESGILKKKRKPN